MQSTTNYNLQKPEPAIDNIDITVINVNMDTIDSELKKRALTTDIPSSLPANGGNATTVNSHTANATPLTIEKTDLVGMVNELFNSANNGKSSVASAIGSPSTATETFAQLASDVNTAKSTLATNITNKGVNANGTETLSNLAAKVSNIARGQGTAVESQVLNGVTFSNSDGTLRTGNMPENGAVIVTPSTSNQTIANGHHNGSGYVKGEPNLIASNLVAGNTYFGIAGAATIESLGGRKRASGTQVSSSGTLNFTLASGGTQGLSCLSVGGLTFTPTLIYMWTNVSGVYPAVYNSGGDYNYGGGTCKVFSGYALNINCYDFKGDVSPATVTATGFTLPVYASNTTYNWIAYE